jgi:RNA polymerase sigma-70 factor, ECF subfamily
MTMAAEYRFSTDPDLFHAFVHRPEERDVVFKEIYSRYSHKVYAYCLRMTADPDDANDMFQETFLRFYRHEHKEETINNLLAYLIVSARHVFLNNLRVTARWSPFGDLEPIEQAPMYDREELLNMIHSALDLLGMPYKEAFILRYYQGLSYKSIAEITGDSIASLKVRVMRAKDQIRQILAPYINDLSKS